MASREEGHRRIRRTTVGLAAASLAGTVAIAATVAVQANAATPGPSNDATDNGTAQNQGGAGSGFTPPGGGITNGGNLGGSTGSNNSGFLPHARSGGSR
jgi:Tfp pilus assembly protein FimT